MKLSHITHDAVVSAIAEFDKLGQDRFLKRYGFKKAIRYYLIYDNKSYDSKAILGVARKFVDRRDGPLGAGDFSGGKSTTDQLRKLGLEIAERWVDASAMTTEKRRYKDFGKAPNDNVNELQTFARRVRRGQQRFRDNLMRAYQCSCVVTGPGPGEVLEAVHIEPHAESGINKLGNGLLMRADIHVLFDAHLLGIDPRSMEIVVNGKLKDTLY